ncbi:MAG: nitroreductase [Caulobacter sp.]|nr:nitroreductase [Caulobacter sp.]
MDVFEALAARRTCRAFKPSPVPRATVEAILTAAGRAPSGGNLQPWRVWALAGEDLAALKGKVLGRIAAGQLTDGDYEYLIYPPQLKEPYLTRQFRNGEQLYGAMNIARDDAAGRMEQFRRNFELFGAPVGIFLAIDRTMDRPQWADLGMYLQSLLLAATARGLSTAALESWSLQHRTVREHLAMPADLMLFCAVALGLPDEADPVNAIRAERAPLDEVAVLRGF